MLDKAWLVSFLRGLEVAIPPPSNCHHAITYARDGNSQSGWTDRLALHVHRDGTSHLFFLDQADFEATPSECIAAVIRLLNEAFPDVMIGERRSST